MSHQVLSRNPVTLLAVQLAPRVYAFLTLGVALVGLALYMPNARTGLALLAVGTTFLCLAALVRGLANADNRARTALMRIVGAFVEQDASPSFTTDADGAVTYQNRAARERFGVGDAETLTAALGDFFASPSATLFRLQKKAGADGAAREEIATSNGHIRLAVHSIGTDGFLWRLEDLGDPQRQQRAGDNIGLPMMTVSKAGTVLFMNNAMRRLLGHRVASIEKVIDDLPLRPGQHHQVSTTEGRITAQARVFDSTMGRQEVYLLPVEADEAPQSPDWNLFDDLPVPLLKVTPDGTIAMCNRQARELLAVAEPLGCKLADLVEGLGRSIADWLATTAAAKGEVQTEIVRASRQAQELFIQVTLARVCDGGKPALIAVLNDATKLKTLEAQFVQSQKMQAIGQLAGGVAHDFNNLLTAISGHCDLLLLRHNEGDPEYADLVQIHQNANRAASLVGQLLAFSRKQTLTPEVIEVQDALNDLAHLLNRLVGERVRLSLEHGPDLWPIRADRRQLEQVIMNLVVNARDAMPDGGEIRVSTRNEALKQPLERDRATVPPGEYVVISVSDEGCGIAPDKLPKIFEPFFTTKRTGEGTGLGLSMAYGIVKQSGGYIFADSSPGRGSDFTLFFPAHRSVVRAVPEVAAPPPRASHGAADGVVLLVEDEAPVRAFAARALQMRGHKVLEADSAERALEILEDPDLQIDVIVSDVIMPGMDGPSWVARAQQTRPDVRVVFMSGYAEESFAEQQARIPNSVFLPKPFSLSELAATVSTQVA